MLHLIQADTCSLPFWASLRRYSLITPRAQNTMVSLYCSLTSYPSHLNAYLFKCLGLLWSGVHIVLSLEIKADAHVRGYVGEKIKLKCTFKSTSSVTDKLTIDWTYRPPSSSRTESIFHYQSFQYPTTAGTFRDRISWVGDVYRGDASISISNPTLKDNGTFSCAVKNPPDVHHNIPATELTVTERGFGTMLSSVALLSVLVFLPSAVVVILLLVRMARKSAGLKKRSKSGYKKSSIEVSDDTDQEEGDDCMARLCVRCAECLDSDYEETYWWRSSWHKKSHLLAENVPFHWQLKPLGEAGLAWMAVLEDSRSHQERLQEPFIYWRNVLFIFINCLRTLWRNSQLPLLMTYTLVEWRSSLPE